MSMSSPLVRVLASRDNRRATLLLSEPEHPTSASMVAWRSAATARMASSVRVGRAPPSAGSTLPAASPKIRRDAPAAALVALSLVVRS